MPKAIIFDADGVLVISEFLSSRLMKSAGAPAAESFDRFFGGPFQKCLTGHADLREEVQAVLPEWKWEKSIDELFEYWFHEDSNRVDHRFDAVINNFKQQGIICGLGTNNEKYRTHDLLHKKGIGKWFNEEHRFSSARVGLKKPDPKFFEHIAKDLKLKPSEIDFWDDDAKNVAAAKAFGMNAHLYNSMEEFKKHYAL